MSMIIDGTNGLTFNNATTQTTATPTPSAVGQIPIGNSSNGFTTALITAGTGISITNASGAITVTNSSPAPTADTSSITSNGWYKNGKTGMIIQWGSFSFGAYASGSVTLPTTYPTAQFTVTCGLYFPGNNSFNQSIGLYPNGTSAISYDNSGSGAGGTGYFISIGY